MSELYSVVGSSNPDYLLSDPQGADIIAIPCTPGKGEIKRGTVMFREANGMWSPAAAANIVNTNMLAVINEAVNTGAAPADGETAIAEDAAAYRAGRFIDGRVTLTADAALTDAHKVVLRQQGIVFDKANNAAVFDNTVAGS